MRTKYFFFAALAVGALASCSSDEFMGENNSPGTQSQGIQAIDFGSGARNMTRSTGNDITKLAGNFMVAATKTVGSSTQKVIDNYKVWNKASDATDNTTNRYGWEYVGDYGTKTLVRVKSHSKKTSPSNIGTFLHQPITMWQVRQQRLSHLILALGMLLQALPSLVLGLTSLLILRPTLMVLPLLVM